LPGTRVTERRDAKRVMATEFEGKKPHGGYRRRWEYDTEMYLTAFGGGGGVAVTELICLRLGAGGRHL
jgi:hypothetical protein